MIRAIRGPGRAPRRPILVGVFSATILLALTARAAQPITVEADLTDAARRVHHAHLTIPVSAGPLTLLYPKWIPGEHAPTGPVGDLVNLKITAGGKEVAWRRDAIEMYAFHCDVPEGTDHLNVSADFLTGAPDTNGFTSAASTTPNLAMVAWSQFVLYPKGTEAAATEFRPSLVLPEGWKFGTALTAESTAGATTTFAPVTLERLIDSPVLCGKYFRELPIGPKDGPAHFVEMAADSAEALEVTPETKAALDRLIVEAGKLFGRRPYNSYKFLVSLSDHVAHFGLEHHECSDDRVRERTFIDETLRFGLATLLPHEYVHSWNGKYRRPAGLATGDYESPMQGELLWVYEGLTEYLGMVLAARSGLATTEQMQQYWAWIAQELTNQQGRAWRPLVDTTIAAQLTYAAPGEWTALRRSTDFYDEGALIWMDADTLIREKTKGKRSLDDFCKKFHGGQNGLPAVKPYTVDDVIAVLNDVVVYDWKTFLAQRIDATTASAPLDGIERGGWELRYSEMPSDVQTAYQAIRKESDRSASIGIFVDEEGAISDVVPGSPADKAGLAPSMIIRAVNARRFSAEVLDAAITAAKTGGPLDILVENGEFFRTYSLAYTGGLKFPMLLRNEGKHDWLSEINKPLSGTARAK